MTPGTAELTKIAIRSSVENVRGVGKQPAHPLQHRAVLRPGEAGVALEQTACSGLGLLEQAEVPRQIGQCQLWQAVLAAAEEVAGPPELQVLLGDPKAVGCGGQSTQPGQGVWAAVMRTQ